MGISYHKHILNNPLFLLSFSYRFFFFLYEVINFRSFTVFVGEKYFAKNLVYPMRRLDS